MTYKPFGAGQCCIFLEPAFVYCVLHVTIMAKSINQSLNESMNECTS